jgi:IS1 family transposase
VETIVFGLTLLSEGVSLRKVARILRVDKDTVLRWLVEAAKHSKAVLGYMMHNLHVTQVQLDEMYALLAEVNTAGERRKCWVWVAIDPISKLLLAIEVGDRDLAMAQRLVHGVVAVLAAGQVPMFATDQFAAYNKAILTHFGYWVEKVSESGRILRRWMPEERLQYAQVKKQRRRRKIVSVTTTVVFGSQQAVEAILDAVEQKINTAFVERVNRTLRAHVPGLGRRVEELARSVEGLRGRLMLVMGYYNFCLTHLSLREELPLPIPTKGNGSPKKWLSKTPAMAAGITDHVWTMQEFLMLRVPPWPQESVLA